MKGWLDHQPTWRSNFFDEVEKMLVDDALFNDFKNNPVFNTIINNDRRGFETVTPYFNYIKEHKPDLLFLFDKFATLDDIGNPPKLDVDGKNISSGVVVFAYVLTDVLLHVGETKNMDIVEIGSGYGGQSKIIQDYGCKSYTCIDVEPTIKLANKYLDNYYKNTIYSPYPELKGLKDKYDLVISNWCLSELSEDLVSDYSDRVISKCSNAFIWSNLWDKVAKENLKNSLGKIFPSVVELPFLLNQTKDNYLLICKK